MINQLRAITNKKFEENIHKDTPEANNYNEGFIDGYQLSLFHNLRFGDIISYSDSNSTFPLYKGIFIERTGKYHCFKDDVSEDTQNENGFIEQDFIFLSQFGHVEIERIKSEEEFIDFLKRFNIASTNNVSHELKSILEKNYEH